MSNNDDDENNYTSENKDQPCINKDYFEFLDSNNSDIITDEDIKKISEISSNSEKKGNA